MPAVALCRKCTKVIAGLKAGLGSDGVGVRAEKGGKEEKRGSEASPL